MRTHRNRDDRNDGGAQLSKEQKHHERDEDKCLEQRFQHLMDGVVDENRRVVGRSCLQSLRKARAHLVKRFLHGCGSRDGVGTGRQKDSDRHGRMAVEAAEVVVVHGAQFHPRHVFDAQRRPVSVGAQHDVAELLRDRSAAPVSAHSPETADFPEPDVRRCGRPTPERSGFGWP